MAAPITFRSRVRRWRDDAPGGLAVADIPPEIVTVLGGRRQYRVEGSLNGSSFRGSTMLVAGGGFSVGISRAALDGAGVDVGDEIELVLARPSSE
jgi:Domain of unknown function (DUF1905)